MSDEDDIKRQIQYLELNLKISIIEKLLIKNNLLNEDEYKKEYESLIDQIIQKYKENANITG